MSVDQESMDILNSLIPPLNKVNLNDVINNYELYRPISKFQLSMV